MEDLYSATAEKEDGEGEKAPHWMTLSNSVEAQEGIDVSRSRLLSDPMRDEQTQAVTFGPLLAHSLSLSSRPLLTRPLRSLSSLLAAGNGTQPQRLLSLCADDAVTLLCTVTSYLSRKYPKAYPEEATLLKKAVKRVTPDRTSYMHISPKVSTSRSLQSKSPASSPRNRATKKDSPTAEERNQRVFHMDKVVDHAELVESRKTKFGRPISYERAKAKASVSHELHDWAQDRKIKAWLRERKKKEEGRR